MKNLFRLTVIVFMLSWLSYHQSISIDADWWDRPSDPQRDVPTQPLYPRGTDVPTQPVPTTVPPTSVPTIVQPTLTVTTPPIGGNTEPTSTPVPSSGGGNNEGKKEESKNTQSEEKKTPSVSTVRGLSRTGSGTEWSDIMLPSGILCLLLYVKSKIQKEEKTVKVQKNIH